MRRWTATRQRSAILERQTAPKSSQAKKTRHLFYLSELNRGLITKTSYTRSTASTESGRAATPSRSAPVIESPRYPGGCRTTPVGPCACGAEARTSPRLGLAHAGPEIPPPHGRLTVARAACSRLPQHTASRREPRRCTGDARGGCPGGDARVRYRHGMVRPSGERFPLGDVLRM